MCLQDPAWRSGLAQRWQTLRTGPWSDVAIQAAIAAKQAEVAGAAQRAAQKWTPLIPEWNGVQLEGTVDQIFSWLHDRLR